MTHLRKLDAGRIARYFRTAPQRLGPQHIRECAWGASVIVALLALANPFKHWLAVGTWHADYVEIELIAVV